MDYKFIDFNLLRKQTFEDVVKQNIPPLNTARNAKPKHPRLCNEKLAPGDKKCLQQERKARASKFFAYGFGPVSGKNIVIEEIGEVDDDEEDYGEYQGRRVDGGQMKTDIWNWNEIEAEMPYQNEFAEARSSKGKK